MPDNTVLKNSADQAVKNLNSFAGCDLSPEKIQSEIKNIMGKPEAERSDLLISFYKGLAKEIFEYASYKRSLMVVSPMLTKKYIDAYGKYSLTSAMDSAKACSENYMRMIDPEYTNNYEFTPDQLKDIMEWEKKELRTRNSYDELARTTKDWNRSIVNDQIKANFDQLRLDNKNPEEIFHFSGDYSDDQNKVVADMYCKVHHARAEVENLKNQNKKSNIFRRLVNYFKISSYNKYINKTCDMLKKVGFDEAKHGDAAIEQSKKILLSPFNRDIEISSSNYIVMVEQYTVRHTEKLTVAADRTKQAEKMDADPATSYINKLKPFADKYGIEPEKFINENINWRSAGESYDEERNISITNQNVIATYLYAMRAMINKMESDNKEINITDILKDARQLTVMTTQHYSPAYSLDEFINADTPPYLLSGPDVIKGRVNFFVKKASPEQKAALAEEAGQLFDQWRANAKQTMAEDIECAIQLGEPRRVAETNDNALTSEETEKNEISVNEASANEKISMSINLNDETTQKDVSMPIEPNNEKTKEPFVKQN
jgi:hypothetical protein